MNTQPTCPVCHAPLGPNAPQGLCPACLLKAGIPSLNQGQSGLTSLPRESFTPPAPSELAPHFPQLEILACVGQGGMGAVYRARQPSLDRVVALKILRPHTADDLGFAERFTREARALAKLNHPHIVAVHDFGQAAGYHYFIMEFVDGPNLRHLLNSGQISPKEALAIVPQICGALQFAHDHGIVHRDIKPENILLDKSGTVKIADFGLAKLIGAEAAAGTAITAAGDVMGTPHYMAPEQVEAPQTVDHRADIYSLGVVFYQMLTGELPLGRFGAPSGKVAIDVRIDDIVLRALEKEPALRYQQASVLRTEVENVNETQGAGFSGRDAIRQRVSRSAMGLAGTGVLALATAAALVLFAYPAIEREGGDLAGRVVVAGMAVWSVGMAVLTLLGSASLWTLRNYRAAKLGSVAALIAGPASVIGLPFGIRALWLLGRPEVRAAMHAKLGAR